MYRVCLKSIITHRNAFSKDPKKSIILFKKWACHFQYDLARVNFDFIKTISNKRKTNKTI